MPKPVDKDIMSEIASTLSGGEVEPLSKLAAKSKDQRAELFEFTDADRKLLQAAISSNGDDS